MLEIVPEEEVDVLIRLPLCAVIRASVAICQLPESSPVCRVLEYPLESCGRVGLMCLACPGKDCPGCPKVTLQKTQPKITLKIKKEVVEKKHKKKDKKKKEKRKEKASLPSGLVMTCSSCSTVFNSVTGLGEHRRICKAK